MQQFAMFCSRALAVHAYYSEDIMKAPKHQVQARRLLLPGSNLRECSMSRVITADEKRRWGIGYACRPTFDVRLAPVTAFVSFFFFGVQKSTHDVYWRVKKCSQSCVIAQIYASFFFLFLCVRSVRFFAQLRVKASNSTLNFTLVKCSKTRQNVSHISLGSDKT